MMHLTDILEAQGLRPGDAGFLDAIPIFVPTMTDEEWAQVSAPKKKRRRNEPAMVPIDPKALHLFALGRGVRA